MKPKKCDTSKTWIAGIQAFHDRFIKENHDQDQTIEAGGESWTITEFQYSVERHRLAVEFDGGDLFVIVEYVEQSQTLTVSSFPPPPAQPQQPIVPVAPAESIASTTFPVDDLASIDWFSSGFFSFWEFFLFFSIANRSNSCILVLGHTTILCLEGESSKTMSVV